jgi:phage tail sheath protein FI
MPFQISPGVNVSEIDLTTIIPAVSTSTGAFAGHLRWGPVGVRVLVDSEDTLVNTFGKPNTNTAVDFFTAANFLSYGNALYLTRVVRDANTNVRSTNLETARNAHAGANTTTIVIKNQEDYNLNYTSVRTGYGGWVAKYPGVLGNNLRISTCASSNAYQSTLSIGTGTFAVTTNTSTLTIKTFGSNTSTVAASSKLSGARAQANTRMQYLLNRMSVGDIVVLGPDYAELKIASIGSATTTSLAVANTSAAANTTALITLQTKYMGNTVATFTSLSRRWEFYNNVSAAPGTSPDVATRGGINDELHVVVVDEDGSITGYANTVLEVHEGLTRTGGAKSENGTNIYYPDYINQMSRWVWWFGHAPGLTTPKTIGNVTVGFDYNSGSATPNRPIIASFAQGRDGALPREADYINAYNLFKSSEDVDVSLVLGGASTQTRATHIINNIAEYRKDCVAVFSPPYAAVVNNSLYAGSEQQAAITFRNLLPSSSYAIMDSAWKYQYDKYTDLYRYIPCNGDTAGLMVRTDTERDPWWSPAGYNRGGIKNVIKLAYNPGKADRDQLYKNGINPVVTFPGQGTVLFGDKTMLSKPSAFDRINVRRLFIVLEKAIATAAKFTLFEFNDAFTRAQFKALVEPFLRDVQGRRGITDFRVVCDETNNTGEVIDRNEFVGDIYIKPARSINFIQLNFVAVRSGVDFTEVVGKF